MKLHRHVLFPILFAFIFSFADPAAVDDVSFSEKAVTTAAESAGKSVIPGGKSIGVTLCTDGVMVVNVAELEAADGSRQSPAAAAGIKPGDLIKSFNGHPVCGVDDLTDAVSDSGGAKSSITLSRDGKAVETLIYPVASHDDGNLKIGVWVKDAASGIGTLTFYDPETHVFAALGHGICDSETGRVIPSSGGNILSSTIVSVKKGKRGAPGELKGVFTENRSVLGKIAKNNGCGIFGKASDDFSAGGEPVPIASKSKVRTGAAYILANVEGNRVESYKIEILRVMPQASPNPKGMVLKITDSALLEKTGGIVQGMSGCPIIQDGKLVGAVTHVFVNDPTRGYGIFAEWMLENTGGIT